MSPWCCKSSTDAIANVLVVLQQLESAAVVAPFVPCLGVAFSAAIKLVQIVQQAHINKHRARNIASRVLDVARIIQNIDRNLVDYQLESSVCELKNTLDEIAEDLLRQFKRKRIYRILRWASIGQTLDNHLDRLDRARQNFITARGT
ncbi:hypothetical protein B0H21DRAFT_242979 [Amylocystis lapponica]|nr:hypothetical protein B0H21DRAFT_242979 [Amylocystis lapponica]